MRGLVQRHRAGTPLASHRGDVSLVQKVRGRRWPTFRQYVHIGVLLSPFEKGLFRLGILLFFVGFVWSGRLLIAQFRVQAPAVGGTYIEAVVGEPQLVNPIFATVNDADRDLTRLLFSGLMQYDKKQRLVPDLSVRYDVSEDKKTYTFYLRQNVLWHDGEALTANDVAFTIDRIQNPAVSSPLFVSFQGVKTTVIDPYTVEFVLPEPFAGFLPSLTVGILPEHVWDSISPDRMHLAGQNVQPIGSGPFRLSKLEKTEQGTILSYELKRFEDYYRQPPFIATFVFQFYPSYDGAQNPIQDLRDQHVDGLNFVPRNLRDKVQRKHIDLHTLQIPQYSALFLNQDHNTVLTSKEVRQALALGLDKDRILRESLGGEGTVIDGPILPGFPGYSADILKTPYHADDANTLLDKQWSRVSYDDYRNERKEALVKIKTDEQTVSSTPETLDVSTDTTNVVVELSPEMLAQIGAELDQELHPAQTFFRKNKAGDVLSLTLVTSNDSEQQHTAELIAGLWQEIGVQTKVRFVDPKDFNRDVLKKRDYDVLFYGVIVGNDPDQYPFWHSSQIDFPGLNLSRYVNRKADDLLVKARENANDADEADLYTQFQTLILDDIPAIFLYTPTYTYATTDKLQGFDVAQISHPSDRFANVLQWYLKTTGTWQFGKTQ